MAAAAMLVMVQAAMPIPVIASQFVRPAAAAPAAAMTNAVTLRVEDLESHAAIPTYRWVIYADDTGDTANTQANRDLCFPATNPDYPNGCPWPSVHSFTGGAGGAQGPDGGENLITHGDQNDLNTTTSITLPDGDYMISVIATGVITSLAASAAAGATSVEVLDPAHFAAGQAVTIGVGDGQDEATITDVTGSTITFDTPLGSARDAGEAFMAPQEYKIDGAWFSVPADDTALPVVVSLQPDPLPLATLKVQIFNDLIPNGQFDLAGDEPLAGFVAHIEDVLGEVTTDWFGNPLCAEYDTNGDYVPGSGGQCVSDADGVVTIPNLGSNRYGVTVVPPDGENWIQTSSLEGGLDWDSWIWEGFSGYDVEMVVPSGPVPLAQFGFIKPTAYQCPSGETCNASISGRVVSTKSYLPPAGGDTFEGPVQRPWVAISSLGTADDHLVYAGRGGPVGALAKGQFNVTGLAPGAYSITMWDQPINLLMGITTVVVGEGENVDIGDFALSHWFSEVHGTVYNDTNENGVQDAGEPGLANFPLVIKQRDNSIVDQFARATVTDSQGHYSFEQTYPYGFWTILEAYSDLFYTTGVTYQADNQPSPTTVLGAGVDVSVFNMDGLNSRVDWGVHAYAPGTNGGIVGSVTYAVTRNELDPRLAATEDYEPGIPGLKVELWQPVPCTDASTQTCDAANKYVLDGTGAYAEGKLLNTYVTEEFARPINCQARDAGGNPIQYPFMSEQGDHECIESPLMGSQVKTGPTDDEFSLVNGNYGFGDGCFNGTLDDADPSAPTCDGADFETLPLGDYLVKVVSPNDSIFGRPKYQVVREEDVNVFDGDQYTPAVPPPPCAGALHTVDVAGIAPDGTLTTAQDGPDATVNPGFAEGGGSPFEGEERPLCDVRLVTVQDRKSVAPSFYFFHDVPPPGRLYGAQVEDLALGTNPNEFYFGEKAGIPNAPIGIYDYSGRLMKTIESDPNGFFEVLLPSTRTFNCPLPAGPCPNVVRLIGNDPGSPGHPNPNYNPQYRTFESDWQIWPGLTLLADVALLPTAPVLELPGSQGQHPPQCLPDPGRPQLFAVSQPYAAPGESFTVQGSSFGSAGSATLDGVALQVDSWSTRDLSLTVPAGADPGPHQLAITNADSGLTTINGLTFHVIGAGYDPNIIEVGPTKANTTIQDGINAAAANPTGDNLVVVYPNTPHNLGPLGDYFESIVISTPLKLQGVGPGGVRGDGTSVPGSIINGLGFANTNFPAWQTLVEGIHANPATNWSGNQDIYEGQVVYVLSRDDQFTANNSFKPSIDGVRVSQGDEFGYPSTAAFYTVQGGGIFVNAYARELQITNNVVATNGGSFGGGLRIGTPYIGNNHNDDIRIANNRFFGNGGSNLAGAIGLFAGTNGYQLESNDICGNFSAEYGGGVSHFGLSSGTAAHPVNLIRNNRIWLNGSYDEGAGLMVGGEIPDSVDVLSDGSGPLEISGNVIEGNLAEDDGGGLRFLMAGNHQIDVFNNNIVDNVSAHEGGGVALDDSTNVRFFNNTVMKNLTTATAADALNGEPSPAGLSDTLNSALLQDTLPSGHAPYSDPLMFNNIFWDNRAGTFNQAVPSITGLGDGDANHWDMGVGGTTLPLHPTNSILTEDTNSSIVADSSNKIGDDPLAVDPLTIAVNFLPWRGDPNFTQSWIVVEEQPLMLLGDYHIGDTSPAVNSGAASKAGVSAPTVDIDGETRPVGSFDMGSDETDVPDAPPTDTTGPAVSGQAADPNPTNGAASVTLTATADDTTTGNANVVAAEWWEGAGTPTAMAAADGTFDSPTEGLTASIDVSGWTEGDHTISIHATDANANVGATVTVVVYIGTPPAPPAPIVFADGFESGGASNWSAMNAAYLLRFTTAAALSGDVGMQARLRPSAKPWVEDATQGGVTRYSARFLFDPNSSRMRGAETIFVGKGTNGETLFAVQIRRSHGRYQVRSVVWLDDDRLVGRWTKLRDARNGIGLSWRSAENGRLRLAVNGTRRNVLLGNTSLFALDRVRLGVTSNPGSTAQGRQFFDRFTSTGSGQISGGSDS